MPKILRRREEAWTLFQDGQLTAVVDDNEFKGLESIPDAVDHMLSGRAIGKVVVAL
jgi:NADPH-dependent curcumin reductase CurA